MSISDIIALGAFVPGIGTSSSSKIGGSNKAKTVILNVFFADYLTPIPLESSSNTITLTVCSPIYYSSVGSIKSFLNELSTVTNSLAVSETTTTMCESSGLGSTKAGKE